MASGEEEEFQGVGTAALGMSGGITHAGEFREAGARRCGVWFRGCAP